MITFTKEQLIASAHARIEFAEMMLSGELEPLKERKWSIELALARIALASLEAEAVCVIDQSNLDYLKSGSDADVWPASRTEMGDVLLYRAAHPAPVSVPDEQHSERFNWTLGQWAEHVGGHYQGNDPANYYEFGSFMAVASMLSQFGTVQQKIGWNACRAAMLQGAEPVTTACKLPEGWVAVPVEPTTNQWAAGMQAFDSGMDKVTRVYKAMLAAAPQQEVKNG